MTTLEIELENQPVRAVREPYPIAIHGSGPLNGRHVVEVGLFYIQLNSGGPEEGGWFYESGQLIKKVRSQLCRAEDVARRMARAARPDNRTRDFHSVLCGWEYRVYIGNELRSFPDRRPRYE